MTRVNIIISLFTPIEGSSSLEEINKGYMSSIHYQKIQCCHHRGRKYGGIRKQTSREGQFSQKYTAI